MRWQTIIAASVVLVARVRLGDRDAITELVRTHSARFTWVAWRVVRNWADAEDVVQSALWKAYQHFPDYQERAAFSTWLTRIAMNERVGLLRRRRSEPIDVTESDLPSEEAQWWAIHTQNPEQAVASDEIERTVRQCMEQIHANYRTVVCFSISDELSHEEITERLCLSVAAVKTRLHRGRRVLQEMRRRHCAAPSGPHATGCSVAVKIRGVRRSSHQVSKLRATSPKKEKTQ